MSDEFGFDIPGVQGDPTIEETSYKEWSEGRYKTKGIHSFIKKDERELPVAVPQGDQMVARFRLIVSQQDEAGNEVWVEGPPMSATENQMRMLVAAFGGDVNALPKEGFTSHFMQEAQRMTTAKGTVRECGVKNGWIQWVEGMNPPLGKESFMWAFEGFWVPGGATPVAFQTVERVGNSGKYTETVAYAKFKIISDAWGNPSPYAGYEINIKMSDPYDGVTEYQGNMIPATRVGQKGGIPKDVERWKKFWAFLCMPEYATRRWESDPEKSEYGINELENPLPVIDALAKKSPRRNKIVAVLAANKNGAPKLNIDDMILYKGPDLVDRDAQAAAESKQPSELEEFVRFAEKQAGFAIFEPTPKDATEINLAFTPAGLNWAKETLVPAWTALKLPVAEDGRRYLGKLTPFQLKELTGHLKGEPQGIDSF